MQPKRTRRTEARGQEEIEFAREQRVFANEFASSLWKLLRNRKCLGKKFRREYPIPPFTVDFCCRELKLIVEVDGKDHLTDAGQERDRSRDKYLNKQGYRVLRIPGYQVLKHPAKVMDSIRTAIQELNQDAPEP